MKKLYPISLLLSLTLALALPALAQSQQNNPPDQNQTAQGQVTQSQTTQNQATPPPAQNEAQSADQQPSSPQAPSSRQTLSTAAAQTKSDTPPATGKEPLKYERHEGFWGHMNPFARKKYVNRQLDPVRGRVNELDELTAKNSRSISDVDARQAEGFRNAMTKASEADARAVEAGNRASQAQETAQSAHTRIAGVEQTVGKLDQYQAVTQAELRFRPGTSVLSKNAKDALDQMAAPLKGQRGYILEVQGFSSGSGVAAIENSRAMAQMVVRYLVLNHEIPVYRVYVVGMGNAPVMSEDGKLHRTRGGRVEISLLKNSLGDLNPSSASASAPTNNGANQQSQAPNPQ